MQTVFNLNLLIEIFVLSIATFRLSNMIVYEALPFHAGLRLRHFLGVKYIAYKDEYGENYYYNLDDVIKYYKKNLLNKLDQYSVHSISELVSCLWCCSVWVSGILMLLRFVSFDTYFVIILILSVSALSITVERYTK